jgi:diguanylate cyclase (GGDEF)-like protein
MPDNDRTLLLTTGRGEYVESLIEDRLQIDAAASITKTRQYFLQHPGILAAPVTCSGKPVGWIGLRELVQSDVLSSKSSIAEVMTSSGHVVSHDLPIDELQAQLREGTMTLFHGGLIVVDDEQRYMGRVSHTCLLQFMLERAARFQDHGYRHTLTGLPGHLPLVDRTRELLNQSQLFVVASMDIRGFNIFNDWYGYKRGDQVLRFVSKLLRKHIDPAFDYLAHPGADNFTVLFRSMDWFERCEEMLQECEAQAPQFYDASDRRKGGLEQYFPTGERRFTPIFSLSIGVTQVEPGKFQDHHSLLKAAKDVKMRASETCGGAIFVGGMSDYAINGIVGAVYH